MELHFVSIGCQNAHSAAPKSSKLNPASRMPIKVDPSPALCSVSAWNRDAKTWWSMWRSDQVSSQSLGSRVWLANSCYSRTQTGYLV